MGPLFTRRATVRLRVLLVLSVLAAVGGTGLLYAWARAGATWGVGEPARQPIPFQHSLHVASVGMDCRFCHATAAKAADAGMPSAVTCLSCHSQIWDGASLLEPLRTAAALNVPIVWTSVSRLPEHARFHHGSHVAAGVACGTCHGEVGAMKETVKTETFSMGWCLDCHRDPAGRIHRAAATVPPDHAALSRLTDCSTCHR